MVMRPLIAGLIALEDGGRCKKTIAFAIKYFGSFILCMSIVGILPWMCARREYLLQRGVQRIWIPPAAPVLSPQRDGPEPSQMGALPPVAAAEPLTPRETVGSSAPSKEDVPPISPDQLRIFNDELSDDELAAKTPKFSTRSRPRDHSDSGPVATGRRSLTDDDARYQSDSESQSGSGPGPAIGSPITPLSRSITPLPPAKKISRFRTIA